MKKNALCLLLLIISFSASAGSGSGGATEVTQIVNMTQLVLQYAQQIQQYGTQLQQYQAQLQNMAQNPASALGGNVGQVIQGVGSIMSAANSMGSTMAQIDANFSQQYRSPIAGNYADQYRTWTNTSVGTLGTALSAAGMHRDAYRSDADALQALYNKSQSSTGTVAAVQQLSALTSMQVQQTQKLGDLMASQNVAASTWMASQASKDQAQADVTSKVMRMEQPGPAPDPSKYKSTY
jgi:P-type conjugative transfer protein TrbJ